MEQPIAQQALSFAVAAAFGAALGLAYDILRGLRRSLPFLTVLLDGLFSAAVLAANLLLMLRAGGEFRISALLAELLGAAVWFFGPSRLFLPASAAFWRVTSFPVRFLARLSGKIYEKSRKNLKNLFSKRKKSVTMNKRRETRNHTTEGFDHAPAQICTHYKIAPAGSGGFRDHIDRQASAAD